MGWNVKEGRYKYNRLSQLPTFGIHIISIKLLFGNLNSKAVSSHLIISINFREDKKNSKFYSGIPTPQTNNPQ
jgi:hypothetical protein